MDDKSAFLADVNQFLIENYAITFADTGFEEDEWLRRFGDLEDVQQSVEAYAEKYDLKSVKDFIDHPYGN